MGRNWVQFQKGYSLTPLVDEYGTEGAVPCISVAAAGIRSR